LAIAVKELSNYTGKKVNALILIELGGANTPGCIVGLNNMKLHVRVKRKVLEKSVTK